MSDAEPPFGRDYRIEAVDAGSVTVRHRAEGRWWRFDVAEKNGRLQLVHAAHEVGSGDTGNLQAMAIDAYDTATREARRRGMVD